MDLTGDLVDYWEFEDTPGFLVGSHSATTLTNNNTATQGTGIVGESLDVEGSSDQYLSHADSDELSLGTGTGETDQAFTICLWFKAESFLNGLAGLVVKWDGSFAETIEYMIRLGPTIAPDVIDFIISDGAATKTAGTGTGLFGIGDWVFVVAWHDPTANEIAIQVDNGTPITTSNSDGTWADDGTFTIGTNLPQVVPFDGMIDQVGFWKRVLTSDERAFLYNSGAGRTYAEISATQQRFLLTRF